MRVGISNASCVTVAIVIAHVALETEHACNNAYDNAFDPARHGFVVRTHVVKLKDEDGEHDGERGHCHSNGEVDSCSQTRQFYLSM